MHAHTHTRKRTLTQMHTDTHRQRHTDTHTYTHTHTHTHIHTHTHTHIHTQLLTSQTYVKQFYKTGHMPVFSRYTPGLKILSSKFKQIISIQMNYCWKISNISHASS